MLNIKPDHHHKHGYANSDHNVVIGNFPWYQMLWRSIRGDFKPMVPPEGGYDAFARNWSLNIDSDQLAMRQQTPVVTWLGHVTVLLQIAGLNILTDPTLAEFAGPYGRFGSPRRVPVVLQPEALPVIDIVLISHNHYDHLCDATISRLMAAGQSPHFFVPLGLKAWFNERGIKKVTEMDWWSHVELALAPESLKLHFTPSQHWSRRGLFDTNATLWGGFALEWTTQGKMPWRFFYPGDTGYCDVFKDIRLRLGSVDFLALPIGAYLPRDFMKPQHINPDEAVQIMIDLEAKQSMGVHWGTFMLTKEPFDQPPRDLLAALSRARLSPDRVWLMKQGETRAIPC
jgi:N-acyl-phosphatidylethanolamine-hydrolysing phospholipase D